MNMAFAKFLANLKLVFFLSFFIALILVFNCERRLFFPSRRNLFHFKFSAIVTPRKVNVSLGVMSLGLAGITTFDFSGGSLFMIIIWVLSLFKDSLLDTM